jgi:hypothetical protein
MRITKEQYEEYQKLKKWAKREKILTSVKSVTKLEDDIDEPIKRSVALLALLRCEPTFSCCGFDYDGQPFHKSHQYGEPYIRMKSNLFSLSLTSCFMKFGWQVISVVGEVTLVWRSNGNPHWRDTNCIHYSEEIVGAIGWLEWFLMQNESKMADEWVLADTNSKQKGMNRYWQYPPKKEWVIRKNDFVQFAS